MINQLQALAGKAGGSLSEVDLQAQAGSMAPLPITNAFSVVQSPTQSTVSELTSTTLVPAARINKNTPTVHANEVSVQDNSEISNVGEDKDKGSQNNKDDRKGDSSVHSKSFTSGNAKQVPKTLNLTAEEDAKSGSEDSDSVTAL